jgi:hypothetical protein
MEYDNPRYDYHNYCPAHGVWDYCEVCEEELLRERKTQDEWDWWMNTQPVGGFTYEDEHGHV